MKKAIVPISIVLGAITFFALCAWAGAVGNENQKSVDCFYHGGHIVNDICMKVDGAVDFR